MRLGITTANVYMLLQDLLQEGYFDILVITLEITVLWAGKVLDGLY